MNSMDYLYYICIWFLIYVLIYVVLFVACVYMISPEDAREMRRDYVHNFSLCLVKFVMESTSCAKKVLFMNFSNKINK